MKRLLAQIGITYFSALAVAFYLPEKAVIALLAAAVITTAILLLIRYTRRTVYLPIIALTVAIGCAVNLGYTYLKVIPVQENFTGSGRRIEATLTDEAYRSYSKYYYRLEADSIDGKAADVKLLLKTARPIDVEPFDRIQFTADVNATKNHYYLSKGYYLTVNTYDNDFTVTEADSQPLYGHVIRLRQSLREALDEYLPEDTAALCKAILVGDKYALDPDTKADFRYAGASFFIVVSGLHFSIICLMFFRLLTRLRINRFISASLTLALILLYMMVTGFQPSVVRSGVMMIVLVFSRLFRRIGYAPNSLGLAGIVSAVVFSPYGAGDIGLILSFAATFAILEWSDPIYSRLTVKLPHKEKDGLFLRALKAVLRVLSVSLAANILVFPISVFAFHGFSLVTLLSSLLLYIPIALILILSLLVCIFYHLGFLSYLSLLLSWPLYWISRFTLWLVDILSSLSFSYVTVRHSFLYIWLGITILLVVTAVACRRRYRLLPYAVILSAIILITGTVSNAVAEQYTSELQVYACEDGLTVALNQHGELYLLAFDAKSNDAYRIIDELSERSSGAELAICSRKRDYQNYSKLTDREFAISHYLLYDNTSDASSDDTIVVYNENEDYLLGADAQLQAVEKNGRLLCYLNVNDVAILVIPPRFPYRVIPEQFRRADIIVMSRAEAGYEGLVCDTLIVSSTAEAAEGVAGAMSGSCNEILYTHRGDLSVPLR